MTNLTAVLSMINDFSKKYGYPFPVKKEELYSWAEDLSLPKKGETILYTGGLYQLIPYIEPLVDFLDKRSSLLKLGKVGVMASSFAKMILKPKEDLKKVSEGVLKNIAKLLLNVNKKIAFLYKKELYNGALLYDFGLDNTFAEHIQKVYRILKESGAKEVITVDPHSTNILRSIAPRYIEKYDIEVKSYIEVLNEKLENGVLKPKRLVSERIVIHDPCLYARFEGIIEQPRKLLEKAGYHVLEPPNSRKLTYCCGGLLESIVPELAREIALTRISELKELSKNVVTLCPICFINLRRVAPPDVKIDDISVYLAKAYL